MKVKKGDVVHMINGKDRGKQGRVIDARPAERRVIVENLNVVKRHTRPKPMRDSSGVVEKAAPVPVANVMVVCPTCNRPTRIGMKAKTVKDKVLHVRVCKRADCLEEIDK